MNTFRRPLNALQQRFSRWRVRHSSMAVKPLYILNYHRILNAHNDFPFDRGVISTTPELFKEEMTFCKEHFNVVSFSDLTGALLNQINGYQPLLIITFDDGYDDNHQIAFPILKELDLKATFFLTVNLIGSNKLFWWDEVAYAINNMDRDRLDLEIGGKTHQFNLQTSSRLKSIQKILYDPL